MSEKTKKFDVIFECDAVNQGKMRTDMKVRMLEPDPFEYELATDELGFHGGDGTAPTPLMLFSGGLAACLMTQLRAFSKRLRIDAGEIRLATRLHWQGFQKGKEPYETEPVSFEIDIDMLGSASTQERIQLIEAAKKGCFVEQTLMRPNMIGHRSKVDNEWVQV